MEIAARLFTPLAAIFAGYSAYKVLGFFYDKWSSPLRHYPGPPVPSLFFGNMKQIWGADPATYQKKWVEEYGRTIAYGTFFGSKRLYTLDLKALNHVLMSSYDYQKTTAGRYFLKKVGGEGLLGVEGNEHKQQRRITNPAFGPAQIRELTTIFIDKSNELRDALTAEIQKQDEDVETINVLAWLSKMTLDIIGLAGFNYTFNALTEGEDKSELSKAFSKILHSNTRITVWKMLPGLFPALRPVDEIFDSETREARATMHRVSRQLVDTSKAEIEMSGGVKNNDLKSKDLLSLLLRANLATDLPEHQRMSDAEVLSQVPTFLVAGHETTSTATTWALFALSKAQELQKKLRDELLEFPSENPTMDELNSFPYLDAVVRETLRLHPPVTATMRVATKDDVLPLSAPFKDKNGGIHDSLHIKKGQTILIPILHINTDKAIWGPDSEEFRPERWASIPQAASAIPGVWGNMLSFLGGPRACIGYRFSIVEIKAILFSLIRGFEFELAVPVEDIGKLVNIVQRPFLRSDPKAGNTMPLKIKIYSQTYQ